MTKKIEIAAIISWSLGCILLGYWLNETDWSDAPAISTELPTIREVQEIIGCEEVDGKMSPDWRQSETQRKWDEFINT